jgi:hypothetical protein
MAIHLVAFDKLLSLIYVLFVGSRNYDYIFFFVISSVLWTYIGAKDEGRVPRRAPKSSLYIAGLLMPTSRKHTTALPLIGARVPRVFRMPAACSASHASS